MNKKLLINLGVIAVALFISNTAFAGELEEALLNYLNDSTFDGLGHRYEDILFQEAIQAREGMKLNDGEFLAKLKFINEDIKTMGLQLECYKKILTSNTDIELFAGIKNYVNRFNKEEVMFLFLFGWLL